jgi:hypothetical protein
MISVPPNPTIATLFPQLKKAGNTMHRAIEMPAKVFGDKYQKIWELYLWVSNESHNGTIPAGRIKRAQMPQRGCQQTI